jgi:hypothetical protein
MDIPNTQHTTTTPQDSSIVSPSGTPLTAQKSGVVDLRLHADGPVDVVTRRVREQLKDAGFFGTMTANVAPHRELLGEAILNFIRVEATTGRAEPLDTIAVDFSCLVGTPEADRFAQKHAPIGDAPPADRGNYGDVPVSDR